MFIVNYHNVLAGPLDALDRRTIRLSADEFRDEMRTLRERFTPMPVGELLDGARNGRVDSRAVAVTFDDGCAGVVRYAWPILRELGMTAALFVITETLAWDPGAIRRDDEIELAIRVTRVPSIQLPSFGLPDLPLQTPDQRMAALKSVKRVMKVLKEDLRRRWHRTLLERLEVAPGECRAAATDEKFRLATREELLALASDGWTIGSHTRTHRALATLGEADVREELEGSRADLREHLGVDATLLAYPYGGVNHVRDVAPRVAASSGYRYALIAEPGSVTDATDWYRVPRVDFEDLARMGAL